MQLRDGRDDASRKASEMQRVPRVSGARPITDCGGACGFLTVKGTEIQVRGKERVLSCRSSSKSWRLLEAIDFRPLLTFIKVVIVNMVVR